MTSEPECTVKELTPVDKFMILASDGVWEFIESQDAVDIVGNCETVEEGCRQVIILASHVNNVAPDVFDTLHDVSKLHYIAFHHIVSTLDV